MIEGLLGGLLFVVFAPIVSVAVISMLKISMPEDWDND